MLRSSSSCSSSEGEVDQLPRERNLKGVNSKGQLQVQVHRAPPLAPSLTPSSTPSVSPCPSPVQTLSSRSSLAGSSSSVQGTTLAPPAQSHSGQAFPPSPRPRRSRPARDDGVSDRGLGPDQRRLQLYVLLARCASLPFCAKQPPELTQQRLKISKQQLFAFKIKVWNFLEEKSSNPTDETFFSIVQEYYEVFLCSRKVEQAFEAGGWSSHELRQAFFRCVERGLQNCETISMREVMQKTWMSKFEVLLQGVAEESSPHQPSLGKDQLLEMFQKVLGIPKLEHQRIYNACQLDNADEQVAQIRRELGRRRERAAFAAKMKTFLDSNMEKTYVEEVKTSIQQLIDNLESLPLGKGGPRNRLVQHPVVSGDIASGGRTLAKYNINISFSFEVVVMEATGLVSVPSGKQVYCTMEMEGGDKLQTEAVDADKPKWHTQGDFTTAAPLPVLKVRLLTIVNKMLSLEDKELGKVTLRPSPMTMKPPEFHDLITPRHSSDENLQLLLHLRMERPPNLKHSGYLLARGKNVWRSWKKRFYALIQGSACTYILCNFQENKVEPQSIIQLDGYTVDYAQLPSDVYGGQVHFSLVREGETFHFGCDDAQDAGLWVQALYRATGQTHRPTLHGQGSSRHRRTSNVGACSDLADPDKASKLIDKVLAADPCDLDHESLFELLQRLTFRYRMKDPYCSLGWFSPGQLFMLDEYCSRYGVSGCHRHLCYLDQLINRAEDGIAIDPTLLHYSYAFCTSHITQNKPDGFSSITVAENAHYKEIKDRLKLMLEHQISHFRFYFPFGLPEGALKATVGLLERVLMEDMSTPVPAEQIHSLLSTCLRRAAMINYMGLSAENGVWDSNVKGLEELHALAEECVDMLLQSEEQHGMLLCRSPELFKEYSESFWSLFAVDMDALLNHQPDYSWEYFSLFHLLNRHLSIDQYLCNGPFHIHLQNSFAPILDSYLETMEASIAQSVHRSLQQETWHPIHSNKSATSLELLGKLQMLQSFITDLQWPNEKYAASIDSRLKNNANDVMACCINRMGTAFEAKLKKMSKGLQMRVDETLCSMYNLLGDAKQHLGVFCCSDKQKLQECKAWIEIEKTFKHMTSLLITRLVDVLHDVLSKLARYDLGTLFSSILSLTSTSMDLADSYVTFVRQNQEIISEKGLSDELQQRIFSDWCLDTFNVLDEWLKDRPSLHIHQFNSLDLMVRMCQKDFERRGCLPSAPAVQRVQERLKVESALVEVAASSRS